MKFSEAIEAERAAYKKGPVCSVQTILGELDAADIKALNEALADARVAHAWIARALTSAGHKVNPETVARHRRGDCDCG